MMINYFFKQLYNKQQKMISDKEQSYLRHLAQVISAVQKPILSYQQLYIIFQEANIKYATLQDMFKTKKLFTDNIVYTVDIVKLFKLVRIEIKHTKPYFYVKLSTISEHFHKPKQCFQFWKQVMKDRYGSEMRWFECLSEELSCLKMKSFIFKGKIKKILMGTQHELCENNISHYFPKNCKNQIEFSTFLSVLRNDSKKYSISKSRAISNVRSMVVERKNLSYSSSKESNSLAKYVRIKTATSFRKSSRYSRFKNGDLSKLTTDVIKIEDL